MASGTKSNTWNNKIARAMAQDPKKAVVLSVLLTVMGVMWARVMFNGKTGPSSAVAASSAEASTDAKMAISTANNDRIRAELNTWLAGDAPPVARNLFAVKFDYFQQDASRAGQTLRAPEGDGFWDKLAKSMTVQADQKEEQRILIENLRLQAAQLRVQSTMMGAQPKALINDSLVGEGDVVAKSEFRVLKIEPRRIVVERKGIKLAIEMK